MHLTGKPPLAVVVDLDDTLFPQCSYLYGAARAVGRAGAAAGPDQVRLSRAVRRQLVAGSDRDGAVDRALIAYGIAPDLAADLIPALMAAFTAYRPRRLPCYPGAPAILTALGARYPVACELDLVGMCARRQRSPSSVQDFGRYNSRSISARPRVVW